MQKNTHKVQPMRVREKRNRIKLVPVAPRPIPP